jgi:Ser/Thr protein kinase RdoA (MazF antagonist)
VVKEENKKQEVIGIIDFGLAMPSKIVCELAIACAYLAMKRPNPLEIIGAITKGFNTVFPLNVAEMNAIFPLMAQRIIISITHSALNHKKGITNEYVYASEKNGWDLLRQLEEAIPQVAVMRSGA